MLAEQDKNGALGDKHIDQLGRVVQRLEMNKGCKGCIYFLPQTAAICGVEEQGPLGHRGECFSGGQWYEVTYE